MCLRRRGEPWWGAGRLPVGETVDQSTRSYARACPAASASTLTDLCWLHARVVGLAFRRVFATHLLMEAETPYACWLFAA